MHHTEGDIQDQNKSLGSVCDVYYLFIVVFFLSGTFKSKNSFFNFFITTNKISWT